MFYFGISSTITGDRDISEAINAIGKSYFKWIEIRCENGHFEYDNEEEIKKTEKLLRENRIKTSSLHPPVWTDISSGEEWTRMKSVREIEKTILIANRLKVPRVIIHPGEKDGTHKNTFKSLDEIVNFTNEWNTTILLENTFPGHLGSEVNELRDIADRFNLSVCLDTSHASSKGRKIEDFIKILGQRIKHLHVSDSLMKDKDDHLFPGKGKINWEPLFSFLTDFNGYLIFELMPGREPGRILNELDKLRTSWLKEKIAP